MFFLRLGAFASVHFLHVFPVIVVATLPIYDPSLIPSQQSSSEYWCCILIRVYSCNIFSNIFKANYNTTNVSYLLSIILYRDGNILSG